MRAAANHILSLKQRGLALDILFIELLEPAARHLGQMWDDDRCNFSDVTIGAGRLQQLLAQFNERRDIPALSDTRRILTMTTAGEQHRFGLATAENFLLAAGWDVRSEAASTPGSLAALVRNEWFAVAGISLSCESRLDAVAAAIKTIRSWSATNQLASWLADQSS